MIEGHGDDIYRYDDLVKMNFSSIICNYPEPYPSSLEKLIALKEHVSPECVMVTNGATEAIYLIAQLFYGSASIIPQPTFNEYADACRIHHHVISYETDDDVTQLPLDRVYWICNPNNPSGNVLMKGFVDYIVRRSPRYIFVVDQSYEAYTKEPLLLAREMSSVTNLIILHSLSKTFSVPGLRLGYVTAHPNTIQLLRNQRYPWSVSSLSIEAGKFLIKNNVKAIDDLDAYLEETERLHTNLSNIEGLRVFETKTNYEHGILIRDCSNFYGLNNHYFRVSTQLPHENDALVEAIRMYLNTMA